jgi:hypothetical protein
VIALVEVPGDPHASPPRRRGSGIGLLATFGMLCATRLAGAQTGAATTPPAPPPVTFVPSVRVQPRYTYDQADANNDFFIARVRFKGGGDAYGIAKYGVELKLDNVGRFARTVSAQIENAWLEFPTHQNLNVRVGLYDAVFSRNALTSDSKLLVMDRSLIKDALTTLGLADNTVGVLGHGRPWGGRVEYAAGVFDNLQFEDGASPTAKQADGTMQMARLGVHLLDPAPQGGWADFRSSYLGKGRRLAIAVNAAELNKAREGTRDFDIFCWGGDLFWNQGPAVLEAEYDRFRQDTDPILNVPDPDVDGEGWYVQGGYMVTPKVELATRYQERDADQGAFAQRLRWTTTGFNVYLRDHNLKVQTEYTFKREVGPSIPNDLFQVQLQIDF